MQGTCLKTEWWMWNYIFMLTLFTFDPGEVAWISFGPKNAACSQNSFDSGRLLHPCSVVSMPCALDQAIVVQCPLHRRVSCFIVQELCESRGGCPGLSDLTSLLVSVDVKNYWTVLRHWSQLVPNMSMTSEDIKQHFTPHTLASPLLSNVYLGFWECFIGYAVQEVDRYGGRLGIMWVSIYPPQW